MEAVVAVSEDARLEQVTVVETNLRNTSADRLHTDDIGHCITLHLLELRKCQVLQRDTHRCNHRP